MTKQFLLYIEWTTKIWKKKELVCEVDASLTACSVKWLGREKEEGEEEEGRRRGGGIRGKENKKKEGRRKKFFFSYYQKEVSN
jgi:hypothetical protein